MRKITVMIVDDEKLVLEDLKTLADWDAMGFEIVATAFNGRQALEKYKRYRPQVVFTDVRMPFMDGLALIRLIRELDSNTHIFLLTAYEDFSYARTAIKYGIKDYVIKSTLNENTLRDLLSSLSDDIRQHKELEGMLQEKRILEYLELPKEKDAKGCPPLFKKAYTYLFIEQDLPIPVTDEGVKGGFICSRKEIAKAALLEDFKEAGTVAVNHIPEQKILVILDIPEVSQRRIAEVTNSYAGVVRQKLRDTFGCSFTIFYVGHKKTMEELRNLYRDSGREMKKKYLLGSGGIYSFGQPDKNATHTACKADMNRIQEMVDRMELASVTEYLENIFRNIESSLDYNELKRNVVELYTLLKKNRELLPGHVREKYDADIFFADWLDSTHIRNWMVRQFEILIAEKERMQSEAYSRPVLQAKEYIFRHYQERSLTIKEIADNVHLSTGHLCAMFKKETGKTLNSYITEVRMEQAKKLLEEGEMKIYEVSLNVGYQSSQYFSQIFYKMTGSYPTDWQKG